MRRGTTPTLTLTVEGVDLTGYKIEVDIRQGNHQLIKNGEATLDGDNSVIDLILTQAETLSFKSQPVSIQVRFINAEGVAGATTIEEVPVGEIIRNGVIEYDV